MAKTCPVCSTTYDDSSAFCPADGTTLIATENSGDLVGSVIADRYLVSSLLGEGGMGRVYLARHVRLPQQAAIKVLHPGMLSDPEAVARFNREAANAARIEHDRVARVFDFGETREGSVYLAMEYVPGKTLRSILEDEHRLHMARAANLVYQVAEGLDAAHRINIVHRDLKPDNIMVVTDDQGVDRAKVVDFGIAKAADAGGQTRLTRTGTVVGTPEFMSPEQVLGESIDARSDVYALALVAYNMFTGVLPFTGSTPERMFTARLIEDPRPLAVAEPGVEWPADLQLAFDRALDKDPATRTATALEFAEAVVNAVEGWSGTSILRGRTPMSSRATTPPAGSTAARDAIPASATAARSSGAVVTPPAVVAAAPPAAPASPGRTPLFVGVGVIAIGAVAWFATREGGAASSPDGSAAPVTAESSVVAPAAPVASATRTSKGGGSPRTEVARDSQGNATPPAVTPPVADVATAPGLTPPAAKQELDSLRTFLEADDTGEAEARQAIPALQRVLGKLGNASDSTWAYLALVTAHGMAGESLRACTALHTADRLSTTAPQRQAIRTMYASEALACVPR